MIFYILYWCSSIFLYQEPWAYFNMTMPFYQHKNHIIKITWFQGLLFFIMRIIILEKGYWNRALGACKFCSLWWRHNGLYSVSNHQPQDCLLNRLFRGRSRKTSKRRVTGLCVGNSPHRWPVTRKMFPFDDVIMCKSVRKTSLGVTVYHCYGCTWHGLHWMNFKGILPVSSDGLWCTGN